MQATESARSMFLFVFCCDVFSEMFAGIRKQYKFGHTKRIVPFLLYFILTKNVFVMDKKLTLLGSSQEKKCYSLGTTGSPVQDD